MPSSCPSAVSATNAGWSGGWTSSPGGPPGDCSAGPGTPRPPPGRRPPADAPSPHHLKRHEAQSGGSGRGRDVPVDAEHVVRVVYLLDLGEALEVGAVRGEYPLLVLVGGLEVDVASAGREGPNPRPRMADPLPEALGVRRTRIPHAFHADHETGVPVPDRPIVLGALVERTVQVKETYLPAWNRACAEQVSYGRKKTVTQPGHVLSPPVIVTARGFRVVEK